MQRAVQKGRITHLAEREGECSEHLRTTSKCPGKHAQLACRTGDRIAADGLPDRPEHQLTGLGEITAQDDSARVQQVAEIGDSTADVSADVGDHPTTARISVPCESNNALHGEIGAVAGLEQREHIARGREGLQTTAVAATADGTGLIKSNMPDFSRCATRAPVDLAADDQPGTHTARDLDVCQVPHPPATAPDQLSE